MKKDFRTAYLNTLGFRGGAQLKTSLEAIFEHRVIDLSKLKKICNLFEIPSQYRSRVWKIFLGVTPAYQEAWDYVMEQRLMEYEDLKQSVNIVRKVQIDSNFYSQWKDILKEYSIDSDEVAVTQAKEIASNGLAMIYHTKEQYFNFQNSLYYIPNMVHHIGVNGNLNNNNNNNNNNNSFNSSSSNQNNNNNSVQSNNNNSSVNEVMIENGEHNDEGLSSMSPKNSLGIGHGHSINKKELNRLLQEYQGSTDLPYTHHQESLRSIAEVFCYVCDTEVDAFWCFNNFLNISSKQFGHKDIGIYHQLNILSRLLELNERALWNHLKAHHISIEQFASTWFKSYFTNCFSPNSLDRIWDKIIGVSLDYMAYIAFTILLTKKPMILEKQSNSDILNYLLNIKDILVDVVLEKAVEFFTSLESNSINNI
ncbi:hypothetical protein DLAC_00295 [Tieghemostelium lacteum]|uniref:TBC1 domain family member 7 n=1 Tax=Tieghemostelium lacteum TaxID=361077 RepID=A0A152A9D1_TIELA|nr:hypothetical protein DLAC_00295 [Tieghemostelium lacteum]|eukprot:KYR02829.1 hypothetical protein DLAC_00295 [Tieghemostelium lacteum]